MKNNTPSFVRQLARLMLSIITLLATTAGIVAASTGAMFTDTSSVDFEVSTGWVDITSADGTLLPLSNLKPGDVLYRPLNFVNSGSLDFVYEITAVNPKGAGASLMDVIEVETWRVDNATDCSAKEMSTASLVSASATLKKLNVGEQKLETGQSETLCFKVSLPHGTSNSAAGKSASVSLTIATWQS
ncbi:unannotated protein [freshwater metagenome]|uniref:Unannotated protein n=1 Tax=freshwater metagenome TaxID=449393 RepID=A0A6J6KBY6_9ZZZZ